MIQKLIGCSVALWTSLVAVQGTTVVSSATSGKTLIDTRMNQEKIVLTFGRYGPTQVVRYSGYMWDTRFNSKMAEVTANGVTLVKSGGEGQVTWRPARVGLHTLHHITDGVTLTRTYYAEGPTVRIVCTQTGTAGSMLCQIGCDMPGATIYYTTDGTEPTTASRVYTGSFLATLPKVKRLLAVAVVDGYPMSQTAYPIISVIEDVSVVSSATSGKMVIDTRAGKGPIETDHAEDVTYSNLWSGDANATATIAVNGEVVKTATGEGVYRWPLPNKGGNYVLTHKTAKTGTQVDETLTATFVVASHEIEIDDVTARQRYPWNGVVDVKLSYSCSEAVGQQTVTLEARDVVGGTNVTCKNFILDGVAKSTLSLSTGINVFQWDAAKDLPAGFTSRLALGVTVGNANKTSSSFNVDLRGLGPWQRWTADASESLTYSSAWATNATAGAKAVVKVMPVLKPKPKYVVIDLGGGTNATHYPVSYLDDVPEGGWSDEYKTSKLVLRHIPAGSFIMGRRATDCPGARNRDLHMVTITRDFYLGIFSTTQRQWELVMGNRPSNFTNETCYATRPVENVSYQDIRGKDKGIKWPQTTDVDDGSFMDVLRRKTGMNGFDLPTEAQWEYACRAGTTTALNDGHDLSDMTNAVELATTARYAYNSGWATGKYQGLANGYKWTDFACGTEKGPDKVGNYAPNAFDLYDMHGNIYDLCLDVYGILKGSIDPCGWEAGHVEPPLKREARASRGGSWRHPAYSCSSGGREGVWTYIRMYSLGFRLCLQGGDVPDLAAAATLVDEAGTGETAWSPTRAGTYYLTHATMNAETNAQLLSAWFEVPGPRLVFTPQGELTNGVMVAIDGAEDGWTIRYTTDGSAPTADSPIYEGPFPLPTSCTVRAVAYDGQGMTSEEFSETFTLHDALGIVGAVARQRYPWNGKVDVDVELKGDPAKVYLVELTAKNLDGGTNLPVKTVSCAGVSATRCVPPGRHRFTWDAGADIQVDGEFPRVAVSVGATGSELLGYARQMVITVDGYAGNETLTDVPVLVRLSTALEGFDYSDFASPSNGADLAFFDAHERRLAYEVDEWHTNGTSLVWVKLPELRKGTRFTAAWGDVSMYGHAPDRSAPDGHEVWRGYAGVWHMNEDSGTAYDSTANGLDALPDRGTNTLANVNQMVAYQNGACGRARVNGTVNGKGGTYLRVPASPLYSFGGEFVAGGWFRVEERMLVSGTAGYDDPRLISLKPEFYSQRTGFEVQLENGKFCCKAQTNSCIVANWVSEKSWVNLVANYRNTNVLMYANGVLVANGVIKAVVDDESSELAFGNNANGGIWSLNGQYDEIRLRGGSLSADRIRADYDMIANRDFCTYGTVTKGMGAAE